ncbi:UDP-N-acetylhexosamine pyrophosphorylase-like protein 1 [Cylas formicarius]|uniref:UDP-N-acetylhexosamine pyrophosphorylase-like protein 1 n=1 Tax=Cylas formicarius TaxID=197179 RepID=UPI00295840D1|nr:UDP-N-acetylhexosamine pyrophosphorylase-like protein 1 [Cylas formicarius]
MDGFLEMQNLLSEYQQSHLLKYSGELTESERKELLEQLQSIDIKEVLKLYEKAQTSAGENKICDSKMRPVKVEIEKDLNESLLNEYFSVGLDAIAQSQVAVIVLSGGQATRLGLPYPKGMCPVGLPSGKTLFQIQAERIRKLIKLAKQKTGQEGRVIWCLMTSEATDLLTDKFLKQNKYFGLPKENVKLFKQHQLPCFDFDGKIILEEKDSVALAPDGNGGLYKALKTSGLLKQLKESGIKYVHVHGVDNILVRVADPIFIGKCIKDGIDCGAKVVLKTDPKEPLGVICQIEDKYQVIEYSEIPPETAESKDEDGQLKFSAGNICSHFFTLDFLERVSNDHEDSLGLHIAKKIVTHVGPDGDKFRPTSPNGIKIEKFVFDAFVYSRRFLAWRVERGTEFSPVKNSDVSKTDCFPTARRALMALHKKWIESNGGEVKGGAVEISPLLSYGGEGLEEVKGKTYGDRDVLLADEERADDSPTET